MCDLKFSLFSPQKCKILMKSETLKIQNAISVYRPLDNFQERPYAQEN